MRILLLPATGVLASLLGCGIFGGDDGFNSKGARSFSDFAATDDGWVVVGDAQAQTSRPDYDGMGGNPDGLISAKDDAVGGIWFFQAPQKYLGNTQTSYGKKLEFDLNTTTVENPFDDYDVILQGGGKTIVYDTANNPIADEWTSYTIVLDETGGWKKIDSLDVVYSDKMRFMMFPSPSKEDIRTVLGDLQIFRIRGEFNTGPDTGKLDNVRFGAQ